MSRLRLSIVSVLLVAFSVESRAVIFFDGMVHTIDAANSFPAEGVTVQDGVGPVTTTVNIVAGGEIGTLSNSDLTVTGISQVDMSGGAIGRDVLMLHDAMISISGGTVGGTIRGMDFSSITFSGGDALNLFPAEDSTVLVSGGTIGELNSVGRSHVNIQGGQIDRFLRPNGNSVVEVDDVTVSCAIFLDCNARVSDLGFMDFRGGIIEGDLIAATQGRIRLAGGTINGSMFAFDQSEIIIVGSSFNFPLGPLSGTSGSLTGTLLDGSALDVTFGRATTASITLVPEPSTALLLASGLVAMAVGRRRRARRV